MKKKMCDTYSQTNSHTPVLPQPLNGDVEIRSMTSRNFSSLAAKCPTLLDWGENFAASSSWDFHDDLEDSTKTLSPYIQLLAAGFSITRLKLASVLTRGRVNKSVSSLGQDWCVVHLLSEDTPSSSRWTGHENLKLGWCWLQRERLPAYGR
jgi:hypothetical protein